MEIIPAYTIEMNSILFLELVFSFRNSRGEGQDGVSCISFLLGSRSFAVFCSLKTTETCPVTLKGIFLRLGLAKHSTFHPQSFPTLVDNSSPRKGF